MIIKEYTSYHDVKPFWKELNQTYKDGELTFDYDTHTVMWDNFYSKRDVQLKIVTGFENERCVGIFPFMLYDEIYEGVRVWTYTEDFIIARDYFCQPSYLAGFFPFFPLHKSDDLNCFIDKEMEEIFIAHPQYFFKEPAGVIRIEESWDSYFNALSQKDRYILRRTLRDNEDIQVEMDNAVRQSEVMTILDRYIDYWAEKKKVSKTDPVFFYSQDKIHTDLLLMERASRMKKLIAMYCYLGKTLIAANFSVRRGLESIDDYICVRNVDDLYAKRGIGIFAILKNMEFCRSLGIRYYNLSANITEYKKKFLNTQLFCYNFSNLFLLHSSKEQTK